MITDATRSDRLGERLREVGFTERAVGLILEQVESHEQEHGLAEAARSYDFERLAPEAEDEKVEEAAKPTVLRPTEVTEPAARLTDPDLFLFAAGIFFWLISLISAWDGLTCQARVLGVGELDILAEGCATAGPGLFSMAGILAVVWLCVPAAWHPIATGLDLPRPDMGQSLRALAIWGGMALLLVTTLLLASIG